MRHPCHALLASILAAASVASGSVDWRVRALDPTHVVIQGDPTKDELAAYKLTDEEEAKTSYMYQWSVDAGAKRAIAGRPEREKALRNGTVLANGTPAVESSLWKMPNGAWFTRGKNGRLYSGHQARLMYNLFLTLAEPLKPGEKVKFALPCGDNVDFTYDPDIPSPLFKVNQVGYSSLASRRYVYLGGWMATLGPWKAPEGMKFELVDADSGKVVLTGEPARRMDDPISKEGLPTMGDIVHEIDISPAPPGHYFVRIPGVGRSMDFRVGREGVGDAFALHMKGLFQQRCGCEKPASLTHWTSKACHLRVLRGENPPDLWEYGSCFVDEFGFKAPDTSCFDVNSAMIDTYTDWVDISGGWHDAADHDRRPMHMGIAGYLCEIYMLRPENFTDSQLAVLERGNGVPDILDEAAWGLRHLLIGQQEDGGVGTWIEAKCHPGDRAQDDKLKYCISRATRSSTMEYAGFAALLARALRKAGGPEASRIADEYQASAVKAWEYATTHPPAKKVPILTRTENKNVPAPKKDDLMSLDEPQQTLFKGKKIKKDEILVFYNETTKPPACMLVAKAAINLYALTGDRKYADALAGIARNVQEKLDKYLIGHSPLGYAEFLFTDVPIDAYPAMREAWKTGTVKDADKFVGYVENSYPYRLPWLESTDLWSSTVAFGNGHPMRNALRFIAAHAITGDQKYFDAACLANDYHCGCNPNGETLTTGLGVVYPSSFLSIESMQDDIEEYVPGITPYRYTYGLSMDSRQWVWDDDRDKLSQYAIWRRWDNLEGHTVKASEYTVWESLAPPATVTGYLMGSGVNPPIDMREPAKDRADLLGYWCLP